MVMHMYMVRGAGEASARPTFHLGEKGKQKCPF